MIRLIVALGKWLDDRFPVKVHVTQDMFDSLLLRMNKFESRIEAIETADFDHRQSISRLEDSIRAIKEVLAKAGATVLKTEKDLLRERFIAGEFPANFSRKEVEAK